MIPSGKRIKSELKDPAKICIELKKNIKSQAPKNKQISIPNMQ